MDSKTPTRIDPSDEFAVASALMRSGMSEAAAVAKASRFARCAALASEPNAGDAPPQMWYVPGRIEVLGKHTDYGGGRSVIAAVERGICALATPRSDALLNLINLDGAPDARQAQIALDPELKVQAGHWTSYPATVARRVARNFPGKLNGANIRFSSDLPLASGMSSSSALLVLCFSILSRANALNEREEYRREISRDLDLSGYLGTIENGQSFGGLTGDRGVGTFGGSEDHTAILRSRAGRLSQYSYCPVRFERDLELPPQYVFAIGVSGVIAQKSAGAREQFNRASALLGAVLRVWRERTGRSDASVADAIRGGGVDQVRALLDSSQDAEFSPRELRDRFDQFYAESEQIIPVAGDALLAGDLNAFGAAVARSQNLGSRLLANTVPQTDRLAEIAIELGAAAASCFGAGFGGSVWAIVRASEADAFNAAWLERYAVQFPQEASRSSFFTTGPGPAAMEL